MNVEKFNSPIGELYIVADEKYLYGIVFEVQWQILKKRLPECTKRANKMTNQAKKQLKEYFQGKRRKFTLRFKLEGTDFQKKVWLALARIPFGQTKTYKDQARYIRNPKAARAIGRTDGLNPLSIILPCHRVIGSNGSLTGYAGGLKAKEFLLRLEGVSLRRR